MHRKNKKPQSKKGRSDMNKMIPFKSQGPAKDIGDGDVIDHGKLDKLDYTVYKRGTIHITDGKLLFKKGLDPFEDAITAVDFNSMQNGDVKKIEGAGDNDHLLLTMKDGTLVMSLAKRGHGIIDKLKEVINKNRSSRKVGS